MTPFVRASVGALPGGSSRCQGRLHRDLAHAALQREGKAKAWPLPARPTLLDSPDDEFVVHAGTTQLDVIVSPGGLEAPCHEELLPGPWPAPIIGSVFMKDLIELSVWKLPLP